MPISGEKRAKPTHSAPPVVGQLGDLVEVDQSIGPHAELYRILALLGGPVEQEAVVVPRLDHRGHEAPVVEHIAVHQDDRLSRQERGCQQGERGDRAAQIVGIVARDHEITCTDIHDLLLDLLGPVADHQVDLPDAEPPQNRHMTAQKGFPAEAQEHLGRQIGLFQAAANPSRHDGGPHYLKPPRWPGTDALSRVCTASSRILDRQGHISSRTPGQGRPVGKAKV